MKGRNSSNLKYGAISHYLYKRDEGMSSSHPFSETIIIANRFMDLERIKTRIHFVRQADIDNEKNEQSNCLTVHYVPQ